MYSSQPYLSLCHAAAPSPSVDASSVSSACHSVMRSVGVASCLCNYIGTFVINITRTQNNYLSSTPYRNVKQIYYIVDQKCSRTKSLLYFVFIRQTWIQPGLAVASISMHQAANLSLRTRQKLLTSGQTEANSYEKVSFIGL